MTREDQDRVGDILRAIRWLLRVKEKGRQAFDGDWQVRSAASYERMVIGEALNNLSTNMWKHIPICRCPKQWVSASCWRTGTLNSTLKRITISYGAPLPMTYLYLRRMWVSNSQ